ncbi:MAG: ceramidase domain-containing protein [Gammaproteobacteria bacterium]
MLDLYCERLGPGLLAEPLNAFTNLAFLLAALHAWRGANGRADARLLAALIAVIGLGSGLFHTLATPAAQWCDVLPIGIFQLSFLMLYLRHVRGLAVAACAAWLAAFVIALAAAAPLTAPLNGSLAYAPALVALTALGVSHLRRLQDPGLLLAAALFLVSLTARSLDLALCARWPAGTHFLWHLLNALLLGSLVQLYTRARESLSPR